MSDKERQEHLKEIMDENVFIEYMMDFEDCETVDDVVNATCKLLVDNFDIAVEGSYIRELIEQACSLSSDRREVWDDESRIEIRKIRDKTSRS